MLAWISDMVVNRTLYPGGELGDTSLRYTWVDNKVPCMVYTRPDARRIIIYVHGNAMTIGSLHESGLPEAISTAACADVITVEYPGYGVARKCTCGIDDGCCQNVATVINYARRQGASNIVLMGRSLGCAIALRTMATNPRLNNAVAHVVLLSGFASLQDMCTAEWQRRLVRDRLSSKRNITTLAPSIGVSIIHGTKDDVVPFKHANILHKARKGSKLYSVVDMGHCPTASEMTHISCLVQNVTNGIHGIMARWNADVSAAQSYETTTVNPSARNSLCPF